MNSLALLWLVLQREQPQPPTGLLAGMFVVFLLVFVAFYAYIAICLMKIAQKTNTDNAWWAWIPILNLLLLLNVARKPLWWIILMLIPLVNIVIFIIVWMAVAEARGKPGWLGVVVVLVPFINLIVLGYLAFSE